MAGGLWDPSTVTLPPSGRGGRIWGKGSRAAASGRRDLRPGPGRSRRSERPVDHGAAAGEVGRPDHRSRGGDAAALAGVPERVEYEELASLAEKRREAARKTIQDALGTDVEKRVSQIARQQAGLPCRRCGRIRRSSGSWG